MLKHTLAGLAACMVSTAYSQSIKVSGTVKDGANKPIANAVVELLRAKHKGTTGSDGTFSLNVAVNTVRRSGGSPSREVNLRKGMLELATDQAAPFRIEILDVKGNRVDRLAMDMASPGTYRLNLAERVRSLNLVIVKASVGRTTRAFTYLPTGYGGSPMNLSPEISASEGAPLAKVAAAVDTLQVSAAGFATRKVELASAESTLEVTLEASGDFWGGPKNPPGKSPGCGKPAGMTSGNRTITSGGRSRSYIIDIPANYNPDTPYRLFYSSHGLGGQASHVVSWNYFGLKTQATAAGIAAVYIAPQAIERWGESDHALFDDLTNLAKNNLCIDPTRIFVNGMSFGGMISYSFSTNHQKRFRAGVGLAPANFNIWLPATKMKEPIVWMQTTGMGDRTCPWVQNEAQRTGSKFIALEKAADNGCTVPSDIPTWKQGDPVRHLCVDLQDCKPGYPVRVCTFDGRHLQFPTDNGGENLATSWTPIESFKFFMQF